MLFTSDIYINPADLGLYYLGSRFYDQNICRFVNADTTDVLMADPSSLTNKNLYAYCDNSPIKNADYEGEFAHVVIGAVIGGAFELASQLYANGGNLNGINVGKILVATAVGGITATTGPLLGAAISGLGNYAIERMNGTTDKAKLVTSFAVGFGASIVGSGIGKIAEKIGGKIAVKSLSKKSSSIIKKTILNKAKVKGSDRNMIKNLTYAVKKYKNLPSTLLGKNIPQTFNSLAVGISGYGTMGAIYGFR